MVAERAEAEGRARETGQVSFNTIAERMRWAIERRPALGRQRGVRKFQRDIEARSGERRDQGEREIPGVTLPSIMTYLNGDTEPTVLFLREAAGVLGVREAWLTCGEGLPTEEENAAVARFVKDSQNLRAIGQVVWRGSIGKALGKGSFGFWDLPDATRENVIRGFETFYRLPSTVEEYGDADLTERFSNYLSAPFAILRIDPRRFGPVEQALLVEALLRPLEILWWAYLRGAGRRAAGFDPPERTPEEEKLYGSLMGEYEGKDEGENDGQNES
jgi:transcriptional regulator with XRE-family HTH domain